MRRASLTFLHPSQSHLLGHSTAFTQYTQETASYAYSDASSIARFPAFHFNPHALLPLAALLPPSSARDNGEGRGQRKANVLAAVLEADGPHTVRVRRGPDAGREVSVLRLVLGDAVGGLARLAAWREVADAWADAGVRRGDVVHLESESSRFTRTSFSLICEPEADFVRASRARASRCPRLPPGGTRLRQGLYGGRKRGDRELYGVPTAQVAAADLLPDDAYRARGRAAAA